MKPDTLLTTSEVQDNLRVHKNTLLKLLREGEFPNAFRLNGRGRFRIPASDVEAFKARRTPQPGGAK